jgi:hypothetical protein
MEVGRIVKFKEPATEHERDERFKVIEDRDDRVLVETVGFGMKFLAAMSYRKSDLEVA